MRAGAVAIPFDPSLSGTDESVWTIAMDNLPRLQLPGAELLVVSPHPDDETLAAGGLIHSAARHARKVTVLSVTDGEAAYPGWRDLGKVRRLEAYHALSILLPDRLTIVRLGIPDGAVSAHRAALYEAVDRLASPTTTLVAPYEEDGHPDHEVTGEVCLQVARHRELSIWRYPVWMWHHSSPATLDNQPWGKFELSAETRQTKNMAMQCFASQLRPPARNPIIPAHVLPYFMRPFEVFLL